LLVAAWQQFRQLEPVGIIPTLTGKVEYCLTCHKDLAEISPSHPVESFGCVSCHAGERLALNADMAHSTLRGGANPSDLSVVEASCGGVNCHSGSAQDNRDHIQRALTSVQTTYAGAIAQIRFTFGAQPDLKARYGIEAIQAYQETNATALPSLLKFDPAQVGSPSVIAFAANCLNCHLRSEPLEGMQYNRFTGCAACHTPTANQGPEQSIHKLTTAIPYTQCNTCHNRGNYNLASMHFEPRADQPADRLHDYYQPIAQFTVASGLWIALTATPSRSHGRWQPVQ